MSRTTTFTSTESDATTRFSDFWELTKPRLSLMNVVTAALGYFAAGPETNYLVFGSLLGGTTLAAFGAAALNMWWERHEDSLMERTASRPTVTGRVSMTQAWVVGIVLSLLGVLWLLFGVNWMASVLTAATVLLYVLAYTPLKKITPWATEIGAIPGALPPLIGWIAAGAGFSGLGWILFAFLFAWQIPHFMAICWNCRNDYEAAGFKTWAQEDPTGTNVAWRALLWTVAMVVISFLPWGTSGLGWLFLVSTSLLGLFILRPAIAFVQPSKRREAGRKLFLATIAYLPLYLMVLVVDRFIF